jgi:hypothetical protein
MAQKKLKFRIDKNGEVHIEAEGFEGSACEEAIRQFMSGLGGDVVDVNKKPQYYNELDGIHQYVYGGE